MASMKLLTEKANYQTHKAQIVASINGVDLEVHEKDAKDVASKSPIGRGPVLVTVNGNVAESNAIVRFLARLRPDTGLYGATFTNSAQVDMWVDFSNNEIEPARANWLAIALDEVEFNGAVVQEAKKDVTDAMTVLNNHLRHNQFLVGNAPSVADITVAVALADLYREVFAPDFLKNFKSVTRWFENLIGRPEIGDVIGKVTFASSERQGSKKKAKGGGKQQEAKGKAKEAEEDEEEAPKAVETKKPAPAEKKAEAPAEKKEEKKGKKAGGEDKKAGGEEKKAGGNNKKAAEEKKEGKGSKKGEDKKAGGEEKKAAGGKAKKAAGEEKKADGGEEKKAAGKKGKGGGDEKKAAAGGEEKKAAGGKKGKGGGGEKKAEEKKAEEKDESKMSNDELLAKMDDEENKPSKKPANPLDLLPKSNMSLDTVKKSFWSQKPFNPNFFEGFWKDFDAVGYSLYTISYQYDADNRIYFMTQNQLGGFIQRVDDLRKYGMGVLVLTGATEENPPWHVGGCWLFRGQDIPAEMKESGDADYYTWTKMDVTNAEHRKAVEAMFTSNVVEGQTVLDRRYFK